MYGIVNLAIEDLVVTSHGEEAWREVLKVAGLSNTPTFVTTEQYPDEFTYRLVQAISETLKVAPEEALRLFGRHWISYTIDQGFGELIRFAGNSPRELLGNIDTIHSMVAATMPELNTPTIEIEDLEDSHFLVHYRSPRAGLAPMVIGLIEGIGEMFETQIEIEHRERATDGADHDVFGVRTLVLC